MKVILAGQRKREGTEDYYVCNLKSILQLCMCVAIFSGFVISYIFRAGLWFKTLTALCSGLSKKEKLIVKRTDAFSQSSLR